MVIMNNIIFMFYYSLNNLQKTNERNKQHMDKQFQIYSVDFNAFYTEEELNINKKKYEIYNKMHDYENYYDILAKCNLKEDDLSFEKYIELQNNDKLSEYKDIQRKEYYKFFYSLRNLSSNERKRELKFKQIRDNKTKKSMAMNNEEYKKLSLEKKKVKDELNDKINEFPINGVRKLNKDFLVDRNEISLFDNSLRRLLGEKINETTLDIICVTITHYNMMEQLINNGFMLDNEKYIMFTASAGQIRHKKVLFMREELWKKNEQAIMCGLTIDRINSMGGMNINKFLAYLALQNSATETLEGFDIDKTIVVDDFETILPNRKVQYIEKYKDEDSGKLYIKKPVEKYMDISIPHSDGFGMHMFKGNKKSFQIRLPFVKGLMGYCNWKMFIEETEGASPIIKDLWGKEHNVLEEDIEFIFTKSQFKMWKYYESWDEYKKYFKEFKNEASYCNEEENRNEFKNGRFNYQYWQSLVDVSEEEIKSFTDPIVNKINDCHDNIKAMLDVFGATSSNKNMSPEQKLLYKYPPLLKDSHFKDALSDKISMIKKNAKSGKFEISSINTFLIPDVYAFMEYLFCGIETPKGLLEDGEVSCRYFNDDKLLLERSPHLYREHGIRKNINCYNCKDDRKELMEKYFVSNGIYTSTYDLISKILMFDK